MRTEKKDEGYSRDPSKTFGSLDFQESVIRRLRKAYGGTQTITIYFPAEATFKLLLVSKEKIGGVICQQMFSKRSFGCLQFGHIPTDHKSTR